MEVKIKVNHKNITDNIPADLLLIDFLRKHGFYSVKRGCDTANCGLCTVLIADEPVLSCAVLTARANGSHITTLEGMQKEAEVFGSFMADEGAEQCGFCSPGFIMSVLAMEKEFEKKGITNPSEDQINKYLSGNLCRCTGYMSHTRAIMKYLKRAGGLK
ncbi:(2Fe-2S)-binding protein [Aminipila terrae]|uniref:2Fe-2S iron-sulfur cluster binding domain-containing protein n=1 Tax=Aminipila terrae TaxID=2697030 RepID=A0A6P1MIU4_9FIRM|nr:2Fe-2S iron-sulfur cluster-binding protein [Aminipila terrae]QHI72534.1 2Fe-2S iron-sulfur cluster binding domain-containing protein [Aminipila terrae]